MFRNLRAELTRKGINFVEFSEAVGMKYTTFRKKLTGKSEFNLNEMSAIKKALGNDFTLEYLFDKSEQG